MTVLPSVQYPMRHMSGDVDRWAVFALLNVTAGDTLDLSGYFTVVRRATLLGVTVVAALAATVTADTIITIPAGAAKDAAVLTVYGVAGI
jgi:hypothetical protein